jgi:hypothetical protein
MNRFDDYTTDDTGKKSLLRLIVLINELSALGLKIFGALITIYAIAFNIDLIGTGTAVISIGVGSSIAGQFFKNLQKRNEVK